MANIFITTSRCSFRNVAFMFAFICLTMSSLAQTPAAFNFENATTVSQVPEQIAFSNAPVSMEKRYYLEPTEQLFSAAELRIAYEQLNGLRGFYGGVHNTPALWARTRSMLFSDRVQKAVKCESLPEELVREGEALQNFDYSRKLQTDLGFELYSNLKFCNEYLGLNYSDRELYSAYFADRTELIKEVKAVPDLSNRLAAFVIATDIRYTICTPNDDIPCLTSVISHGENNYDNKH